MTHKSLKDEDLEVYSAILKEEERQEEHLELIASENFVSRAVMEAQGSVLTNKYAEGYPAKRYYGGCVYVDIVEQLAIDRAKLIFNANFVNVQPHSGSQANFAAYFSVLDVGDTIMGMDLSHGGHLTHGSAVNFSGKCFNFIPYSVSESSETIDYDKLLQLAKAHKPKMIVAGASSYSRVIDFKRFREVADEVGAYLMVDMAHIAGLVAAGAHPSPIEYADITTTTTHKTLRGPRGGMILSNSEEIAKKINTFVFPGMQGGPLMHVIAAKAVALKECMTEEYKKYQHQVVKNSKMLSESLKKHGFRIVSGGTDNHLLVIDVSDKGLKGRDCQIALEKANITTNKNTIPFDKESPFITSGVRIGTAAVTTRGMQEAQMELIAQFTSDVLTNISDDVKIANVQKMVKALCSQFPLYKK